MSDYITFNSIKNNQINPSATSLSGKVDLACTMITVGPSFSARLVAEKYTTDGHNSWIQDKCSVFDIANYIDNGTINFNDGDLGTYRCDGSWTPDVENNNETIDTLSFSTSVPIDNPIMLHEITKKGDYGIAKMDFNLGKNVTSEAIYDNSFKDKYIVAKGWKLSDASWTSVAFILSDTILSMMRWTGEGTPASRMIYDNEQPLLDWLSFEGDAAVYSNITTAVKDLLNHRGEKITSASMCSMYPGTIRHKGNGWSNYERDLCPDFVY